MKLLATFILLVFFTSSWAIYSNLKTSAKFMENNQLTFWVSGDSPSSLDPLKYDFFKHHPIQSMVNCTLTSLYRGVGIASPELAESWSEEEGGAVWKFNIRQDVTYSDGTIVTAEHVRQSFVRIAFLLKNQNTNYVFVHKLKGIDSLNSASGEIPGIEVSGHSLIFRFNEPIERLSETLSFGHFGVVHPSSYNRNSGSWNHSDILKPIGCGPYVVKEATESNVIYEKRKKYPQNLTSPKGFNIIEQVLKASEAQPADIMLGANNESSTLNKSHRFISNGGRAILYLRVVPWSEKSSKWSNRDFRINVRNLYYKTLSERNVPYSTSFFPLVLNGLSEPVESRDNGSKELKIESGSFVRINHPYSKNYSGPYTPIYATLLDTLEGMGLKIEKKYNVSIESLTSNTESGRKSFDFDLMSLITGISLEDPESDVRLMFSKEGINLPDPTGKISLELKKAKINIQFINQQLYDDAIIWPVTISSRGLWVRKDLDLSDYNTLKPLGELQWIGHN